jgi:hypothetical protein
MLGHLNWAPALQDDAQCNSMKQPEPLAAQIQLNFCYQLQTALVPLDAHLSCYSSVATTFYPTFVCIQVHMCSFVLHFCAIIPTLSVLAVSRC